VKVTVNSLTEKIVKAKKAVDGIEGEKLRSKKKVVKRLQRKAGKIASIEKKAQEKAKKKGTAPETKKEEGAKSE